MDFNDLFGGINPLDIENMSEEDRIKLIAQVCDMNRASMELADMNTLGNAFGDMVARVVSIMSVADDISDCLVRRYGKGEMLDAGGSFDEPAYLAKMRSEISTVRNQCQNVMFNLTRLIDQHNK